MTEQNIIFLLLSSYLALAFSLALLVEVCYYKKRNWNYFVEHLCLWVATLMPRKLVYWAAVLLMSYGTTGRWSDTDPDDVRATTLLKRWNQPHE